MSVRLPPASLPRRMPPTRLPWPLQRTVVGVLRSSQGSPSGGSSKACTGCGRLKACTGESGRFGRTAPFLSLERQTHGPCLTTRPAARRLATHVVATPPATALLTAAVVAFLAAAYVAVAPRTWEASQAILIRNDASGRVEAPGKFRLDDEMKTTQETVLEVASSRSLLRSVLARVGPPADARPATPWPSEIDIAEFRDCCVDHATQGGRIRQDGGLLSQGEGPRSAAGVAPGGRRIRRVAAGLGAAESQRGRGSRSSANAAGRGTAQPGPGPRDSGRRVDQPAIEPGR